jgi:apolipoprotein N-acyltransferase
MPGEVYNFAWVMHFLNRYLRAYFKYIPMNDQQNDEPEIKKWIAPSVILSGICWYLSNGLSGDSWFLLWLAPVPVLIVALNSSGKKAFTISFLAYLIGRVSWFAYLIKVATFIPAVILTLLLPLIFALIVIGTRYIVFKTKFRIGIFAFPVFFTVYEFLLIRFSADGTAGSIAYSQANFLPVIQIASVTGILGITFVVTLVPSILAAGWFHRKEKNSFKMALFLSMAIVFLICLFGAVRINEKVEKKTITAGLVVLDESHHFVTDKPVLKDELNTLSIYADSISGLAVRGAKLVVLSERAFNINAETESALFQMLSNTAKENHVYIITGYTNFRNNPSRNSAWVIDSSGNILCDYNKVHLVTGFERQFSPGKGTGLFSLAGLNAGTAICKDLDFPEHLRKYGQKNTEIVCVPAWDFVQDDWLHSRMAILRGVENGFSEVRAARQGRLTISDCYGRVNAEASSIHKKNVALIGEVILTQKCTIYSRFGDWFGILNLVAGIALLALAFRRSR